MTALSILTLSALAAASPIHRMAVVVGANAAPTGRQTLRFAHRDARSVREVLTRVGGVAPEDVVLMLDPTPSELLKALDALALRQRAAPDEQSVVYFYYSGHADDSSLYPGGEPLSIDELRTHLAKVEATVRVGIFDACRGGSWTRAKGLTPTAPLDVSVPDALRAEGTVLFASSSGLEEAHESEALQGSFFTHHLVAGLSGAADASNDGVVTASEAFVYAQRLTVRDSAGANLEPQHPSFEMNLRGRQDFELTHLAQGSSMLSVEQQSGPLQVVELPSGLVLLELPQGKRQARLAVSPGSYLVRRVTENDVTNVRELKVVEGQTTTVDEASLTLVGRSALNAKGFTETPRNQESTLVKGTLQLGLALGASYNPALILESGVYQFAGSYGVGVMGDLRLFWAPLDWLEIAPLHLGATFRIGQRHHHEGLFTIGVDGWGYSNIDGVVVEPELQASWRWWFASQTSLITWVEAKSRLDKRFPAPGLVSVLGGVSVTHTVREVISFNIGVSGSSGATLKLGGSHVGFRPLPLVQVHLTPAWSVDLDAAFTFYFNTPGPITQTYLAGFTVTW